MALDFVNELKGKTLSEATEYLRVKSDALMNDVKDKVIEKDGKVTYNFKDVSELEDFRSRQSELADAGKYVDQLKETETALLTQKRIIEQYEKMDSTLVRPPMPGMDYDPNNQRQREQARKSLGQMFVESKEWTEGKGSINSRLVNFEAKGFEYKTTMTTAAGFAPANNRTDIVVMSAQRRPVVQSFIPSVNTDLDSIKFMEETTFTNNAAAAAENAAVAESAIAFTERTTPVELIGTYLPVTEQQLEIAESVRATIDDRLMLMLELKEEDQILSGSGTTPQLVGFYNKSGIQTQAKGADPTPSAIYKLFQKLRGAGGSGYVEPSAVFIHPNDWTDIRLLQDGLGRYIWGDPSEPGMERIWGKPVIQTTAATENTALSGDFPLYSQIWRKRTAQIVAGFINDDLIKNKLTLKITSRLALVIYRAAAFGTVTGI